MSKISFTSDILKVTGSLKVASVIVEDDVTSITFDTVPDQKILLGEIEPNSLGLKKGVKVEVEALAHPKNAFVLTIKEPKKGPVETQITNPSSPMSRSTLTNDLV